MFCYQCEQTFRNTGCVDTGVCGKNPAVAAAACASKASGACTREMDHFILEALFATGTNVNFDPERLSSLLERGRKLLAAAGIAVPAETATVPHPPNCG